VYQLLFASMGGIYLMLFNLGILLGPIIGGGLRDR
jgi:hypothetical protein